MPAVTTTAAATGKARLHHGPGAATTVTGVAASERADSRCNGTAMSAYRCRGSLTRHPRTLASTADGTVADSADQSGSPLTMAAIVSVTSSPSNARLPVNIS